MSTEAAPAVNTCPEVPTLPQARHFFPFPFDDIKAKPKQLIFAAVYCSNGFDASKAARALGYKKKGFTDGSAVRGHDMVNNPNVRELIKRFLDTVIAPYKARLEFTVLDYYYHRATYDLHTFIDTDGKMRPLDSIPEEWRKTCLDGMDWRGGGNAGFRPVLKLPDRDAALTMLYRIYSGFDPEDARANKLPAEAAERLSRIIAAAKAPRFKRSVTLKVTEETAAAPKQKMRKVGMRAAIEAEATAEK